MKTSEHLSVPQPCHENWGGMNPTEKGRHCQSCVKEVVDFSTWQQEDILAYLHNSKGAVCGRFKQSQLAPTEARLIDLLPQSTKNFARAAAIAAFTFFGLDEAAGQSQVLESQTPDHVEDSLHKAFSTIKGQVNDEQGQPLSFANVYYTQSDGQVSGVTTDLLGQFSLQVPPTHAPNGQLDLTIQFIGYEQKYVNGICLDKPEIHLEVNMNEADLVLLGVVFTGRNRRVSIKRPIRALIRRIGQSGRWKKEEERSKEEKQLQEENNIIQFDCDSQTEGDTVAIEQEFTFLDEQPLNEINEGTPAGHVNTDSIDYILDLPEFVISDREEVATSCIYTMGRVVKRETFVLGGVMAVSKADSVIKHESKDKKNQQDDRLSLFPNPVSTLLTVRYSTSEPLDYMIRDLGGKIVLSGSLQEGGASISTAGLERGIYTLTLLDGEEIRASKKFVVAR